MNRPEFVVFAHARSGSTSLVRAIDSHPDVRLLMEPFNERFATQHGVDHRSRATDEAALDALLEEIYAEHNGIKALDYQLPRPLYAHMLLGPRRVLFLHRRNLLQAVVSHRMSEQTELWHKWDTDRPASDHYDELEPLQITDVRKRVDDLYDSVRFYSGVLANKKDVLTVTYEALYEQGFDTRQDAITKIFSFLGLSPLPAEETERFLDPGVAKLNSLDTYAMVPNAHTIDATLGNDVTGRLFRPMPA